jgi:nitroreductase
MDIYEALYTTRAMRRVRPDPIPHESQARILDAAIRAPSGGNHQDWHFLFVDDPELRRELGALYLEGWNELLASGYVDPPPGMTEPEVAQLARVTGSAQYLADHFGEAPLLLFGFTRARGGASIFPALWSAQLAARAEGIGSTLTTILGAHQQRVLELLGVPPDRGWSMAGCVVLGYPRGRWGVAARRPAHEVAGRNRWDGPLGFEVPEPLWRGGR